MATSPPRVLIFRNEFAADVLPSGGLDLDGTWVNYVAMSDTCRTKRGRITISHECAIALRNFLNKVYPPSVDEVGQQPAAETAAEVSPQQTTSDSQKAAGTVS